MSKDDLITHATLNFKEAQAAAAEIADLGRNPTRTRVLRTKNKRARVYLNKLVRYGHMSREEAKGWWDRESAADPQWGKVRFDSEFADDLEAAKGEELEEATKE